MNLRKFYVFIVLLAPSLSPQGWAQDTNIRTFTLPEVNVVTLNVPPERLHGQTPTQILSSAALSQQGSTLLSDAARRFVGVTMKDYGGVGGVKTVSARGLGSQFSTLAVDGVAVNDCQNGQVDLGRYMLGNSSYISFANGQEDQPLQSARTMAAGNILNMRTHIPEFGTRPFNLKAGAEIGSFGYFMPSISYEQRINDRMSASFWGNFLKSDGDYPFTLYYTNSRTDSSSRECRKNSHMRLGTADLNFFYRIDGDRRLHVKTHYMQGFHALPGPVVFYTQRGSEHSTERLFFSQAHYRKTGRHWDWQFLGKYQRTTDTYEDTAANNASRLLHNEYHQQEGYLSQTLRCHAPKRTDGHEAFSISLSADETLSRLSSNLDHDNDVLRLSALGALSATLQPDLPDFLDGIRVNANILGTWVCDYRPNKSATPWARLSPFAGITYRHGQFSLRYFFKEVYRVPNFNELYYYTVGRPLRPERARQHNIGASYKKVFSELNQDLVVSSSATIDLYLNHVDDKIVAIPLQNMFLWSMSNLGKVRIIGADITGSTSLSGRFDLNGLRRYDIVLDLGYSFQHAVDRTDPDSKNYGHQIPYTPVHSGNIAVTATTPWVDVGYSAMLVGKRYHMHQNTPSNMVKGYVDQGVTLSHEFDLDKCSINVKMQILNIFDVQYEVVRSYPMMGRNYRIGLFCTL